MPEPIDYNRMKQVDLFKEMADAEIDAISRKIFEKSYKKGSTLFVEGMPGEILYIVTEGGIDIIKKTKSDEKIIAKLGPGEIAGEMSLIDSGQRTDTGRTNSDKKLIVITKKSFNEILDSDPKIAAKLLMELLRVINKRLRQTNKMFEEE